MSYCGSKSDARAAINDVELNANGSSGTSPILKGSSSPGVSNKPAGETQIVGRLRAGINKPRTATDSLKRQG